MDRKKIVLGLLGVVVVGIIAFAIITKNQPASDASPEKESYTAIKGHKSAPVQIVEFSDFQCPACKRAQPVLEALREKYPEDVAIVFKHFPLDGHVWGKLAHQSAECANRQGKFWEYHDMLFATQSEWASPTNPLKRFLRYATDLQLNVESFGECLADESVLQDVLAQREQGAKLKVSSTPTFFINGERIVGPIQLKVQAEKIIKEKMTQG